MCLVCGQSGHNGNGCPLKVTICLTCGKSDRDHWTISQHSWSEHDSGRVQRIRNDTTTAPDARLALAREIEAANLAKRGVA